MSHRHQRDRLDTEPESRPAPTPRGSGVVVKNGARIGPYSVIGAHSHISEDAHIAGAILWPHTWVDRHATLGPLVAGRHCQFGRNVEVNGTAMLGDNSVVTDFSRI